MTQIPEIEKKILKFWQREKIFDKLRKKNQGKKTWSFLDGPITANNPMGVHHAWGRTYKDVFQRYKAMQGFDQRFQNGFDCQGLWIEVEVEKELGFKNKKDIERFGMAKFIKKCKERARKYSKIQTEQSIRLGQWMDWDNSYYTMSDENNYAIWHFLKKCWQKGLLYKGRDVVPWCLRCGTAISQHEILTEEYKEVTHKTVFLKFPILKDDKPSSRHLLIWTTTPWTLAANVAVAVHPDFDYIEAKSKSASQESLILAKNLLSVLGKDYQVIKELRGKELIGLLYAGPFDDLPINQKLSHRVVAWDEVSQEEGTGLVHIAPGCGQEDFVLGKEEKLAVIDPVNEEGRYKEGFGWLTNQLVSEVATKIFDDLKKKGFLFRVEDYVHRYPICWRCKSELIFRLVDEWYIGMDKLRNPLMAIAKKIKWIPSFGLPRELDWLKNMHDWLISKKRYWGLALPIFECSCGHFEVIGSYQELKKRAVDGWESFKGYSPHRPYVDKVKIRCSQCGRKISRIPDVGNPWLDAGIVSFSTMKYFSDRQYWRKWFPADLICESFPGQFRNWFYSLIAMSGVLENKPPTKTVFGYALAVDEQGEEMHKSKGNAIDFDEGMEKIGADIMRWMYLRQNPAINLRFGFKTAEETRRKILILWNSFLYFKTYADRKALKADFRTSNLKKLGLLDQWILSRLNSSISQVRDNLDKYKPAEASQAIEDFFINDLSTWYIRRSRSRFQKSKNKEEHSSASAVLGYVLMELNKLIAPMTPFSAEDVYQSIRDKSMPQSIHLYDYPQSDKKMINLKLEEKMTELRKLVTLALAQRAEKGIRIRQPLSKLIINHREIVKNKELVQLVQEEVNVKKVVFGKEIKLDTKLTAELKAAGVIRDLVRLVQGMRKDGGLKPKDKIYLRYSAGPALNKLIQKQVSEIKKEVSAVQIEAGTKRKETFLVEKEVELDNQTIWLGIKRSK